VATEAAAIVAGAAPGESSAGISIFSWHWGHRPRLPANSDLTFSGVPQ
jgi:hypothetical protein